MMLCLAVTAAGVLHNTHAHAAQHAGTIVASMVATSPTDGAVGDDNNGIVDSCTFASGCHSWITAAQPCEWRAQEGDTTPAVTGEAPRGVTAALRRRPPKSLA